MARAWWVNQRRTAYDDEKRLSLIWAPVVDANGRALSHWDRMTEVEIGDVIFHYNDGLIVAVSTALSQAVRAQNPMNDPRWDTEGRMISVAISELDVPVAKTAIPLEVRRRFSGPEEPFVRNGNVKQAYLMAVPAGLAATIADLGGFRDSSDHSGADSAIEPDSHRRPPPQITVTEDGQTTATYRPEQSQLAGYLFGGLDVARCAFCGRELPVRLLVAAHVKPRAKASSAEPTTTSSFPPAP